MAAKTLLAPPISSTISAMKSSCRALIQHQDMEDPGNMGKDSGRNKQGLCNFCFVCKNGDALMLIAFSKTKCIFTRKNSGMFRHKLYGSQ